MKVSKRWAVFGEIRIGGEIRSGSSQLVAVCDSYPTEEFLMKLSIPEHRKNDVIKRILERGVGFWKEDWYSKGYVLREIDYVQMV